MRQSPRNIRLHLQHAHLLLAQCRYADATDIFSRLSEGRFYKDDALAGIAQAWERQGDIGKARHYIDLSLKHNPTPSVLVLQILADIAFQSDNLDRAIDHLRTGIQDENLSLMDQAGLRLSLGKLLDKRGLYDEAFMHFRIANEQLAPVYDWRILGDRCLALIQKFTIQTIKPLPKVAIDSDKPVFVVGLPRSGTSLVERILASHPDVHGAGELEQVHLIAEKIKRVTGAQNPGPDDLASLESGYLHHLAVQYINHLESLNKNAKRIIDKMPGNLMYLGLISTLFPGAKIIHCVRNPLDTCLSCYFQRFNRSNALAYTFNLDALAFTWQQQEKLMDHWKSVLPVPIMDVTYEDVVNDFDSIAKSLLEFCDLEWDESVRSYHKSEDVCYTASYEQVRKPLYKSSLNRWLNYKPHIQSLIAQLGFDG